MRAKGYVQAAFLACLAYGACLPSPTLTAFAPGIGTAQAKEFYTRKRVNGRWVSGRFAKGYRSGRRHAGRGAATRQQVASLPSQPSRSNDGVRSVLRAETVQSETTIPPREDRLVKLQRALEARAQAIATTSSTDVTSSISGLELPAARQRAEPRSVSFDFESGLKTTAFPGGVTVRESFDIGTLKGLASPPPGNENVAAAKP